jgi:hypothetical protein
MPGCGALQQKLSTPTAMSRRLRPQSPSGQATPMVAAGLGTSTYAGVGGGLGVVGVAIAIGVGVWADG